MPTGYGAMGEEGCTFEEFVWGCARAFGALVMMRDDPLDAPIPDRFQVDGYYATKTREVAAKLDSVQRMSDGQVVEEIERETREVLARNEEHTVRNREKKDRYAAMMKQVQAWAPPSSDHVGMKEFMIEQITISDPGGPYVVEPPTHDIRLWRETKIAKLRQELEYYTEALAGEVERTNARNEWLRRLRQSVPQPAPRPKHVENVIA